MLEPKIEIDHIKLVSNLNAIKQRLKENVKVMAVVKSDAYGHGMNEVAATLEEQIDMFGVGYLREGVELRQKVDKDILVMSPCYDFGEIIEHNLILTIESLYQYNTLICYWENHLKDTEIIIRVHIKVDTGMHRFGLSFNELKELISLHYNKNCSDKIQIEGVYSHFASTVFLNKKAVEKQYQLFKKIKDYARANIGNHLIFHIANSENGLDGQDYQEDMIRVGNGLYGKMALKNPLSTELVATVKMPITSIHVLEQKSSFGYGLRRKMKKGTRLGVVRSGFYEGIGMGKLATGQGIGYIIGYQLKGLIKGLIRKDEVYYMNKSLPVVGTVNMQFFQIDLTGTDIMVGDFVIVKKAPLYFKESIIREHIRTTDKEGA